MLETTRRHPSPPAQPLQSPLLALLVALGSLFLVAACNHTAQEEDETVIVTNTTCPAGQVFRRSLGRCAPPPTCAPHAVLVGGECVARCSSGAIFENGRCTNPPPPPPTCTGGQVLSPDGRRCEDPPPPTCDPATQFLNASNMCENKTPAVGCTSIQIVLGQSCLDALGKTLPDAATSLSYWRTQTDFLIQPGLEDIKAHYAYGIGRTDGYYGNGVYIAVLDDGIQEDSSAQHFAGVDENGNPESRLIRVTAINYVGPLAGRGASGGVYHPVATNDLTINAPATTWDDTIAGCERMGLNHMENPDRCNDHGTPVARAAGADGPNILGAAPQVHIYDIPHVEFEETYCQRLQSLPTPVGCDEIFQTHVSLAIRASAMHHAVTELTPKPRYINISYSTLAYLPTTFPDPLSFQDMFDLENLLEALGGETVWREAQDTTDGSIFVFSAGNDYIDQRMLRRACALNTGDHCTRTDLANEPFVSGMLPLLADLVELPSSDLAAPRIPKGADLEPAFLVVVALGATFNNPNAGPGTIASYSNRCGRAKDYCISAPGRVSSEAIVTPGGRSITHDIQQGTSFAAPLVTGAMAVLDQAFSHAPDPADPTRMLSVSPHEIRNRILRTANKSGVYADADIYGQGLLDVQAALTPQGTMSMPSPSPSPPSPGSALGTVRGPGLPVSGLGLTLPAAALRGLAGTELMVLDSHGFPFYLPVAEMAAAPALAGTFSSMAAMAHEAAPQQTGGLGFSAGDGGLGWSGAMTPQHQLHGAGQHGLRVAAGAHLAVSPLMAASLDGGGAGHLAMRARLGGGAVLSAMACGQRPARQTLSWLADSASSSCMALGWDWADPRRSFGLSLRTHRLNSGGGLYGLGLRCASASCGLGGASATEWGLGGFARVAEGLRLGWNYWRGWAGDRPGARGAVAYRDMGHRAGSIALEDAGGRWSLYLQQPLHATGTIAVTLPSHRTPDRRVHHRTHSFDLSDGGGQPLRMGFSGKLALGKRGGLLALDLGGERGLSGQAGLSGAAPYLQLQAQIPW